jgi:hypothetical protein
MAVYMTRTLIIPTGTGTPVKWYTAAYSAAGAAETIYVPDASWVGVTLSQDAAGNGTIQFSTSSPDDIEAGNGVWVDWAAGSVAASTFQVFLGVTAVRVFRTSGTQRISVRC